MFGGLARRFLRREAEIVHISAFLFHQPDPTSMDSSVTWWNTTKRIETEILNTKQGLLHTFLYLLELENTENDFEVKETFCRFFF